MDLNLVRSKLMSGINHFISTFLPLLKMVVFLFNVSPFYVLKNLLILKCLCCLHSVLIQNE